MAISRFTSMADSLLQRVGRPLSCVTIAAVLVTTLTSCGDDDQPKKQGRQDAAPVNLLQPDQTGSVTLTDVSVLGAQQPVLAGAVAPETELLPPELAKVARITLNHQTREGEEFTVAGLRVEVGGKEVAVLASTTCGAAEEHAVEVKGDQAKTKRPKPAPVPVPSQASAPVTG